MRSQEPWGLREMVTCLLPLDILLVSDEKQRTFEPSSGKASDPLAIHTPLALRYSVLTPHIHTYTQRVWLSSVMLLGLLNFPSALGCH